MICTVMEAAMLLRTGEALLATQAEGDMAFLIIQPDVMTQAQHSAQCLQRGVIHIHRSQYYMRHEDKDFPMLSQPLQL
jgi:hypothetical protein